jgi:hypothetical protein
MIQITRDRARWRALTIFTRITPTLQPDLLADGTIADRFEIAVSHPTLLSSTLSLKSETLFAAFRATMDGTTPPPIFDQSDNIVDARVSIDPDYAGLVEVENGRWRFPHAGLLSDDPNRRGAVLKAALARHTITASDSAETQARILSPNFSDDDFLGVIAVLQSSHESFALRLRERASAAQIGEEDLLPEHSHHWTHLSAPRGGSTSLSSFIADELAAERTSRLAEDPVRAFASISLNFAAPALVPMEALRRLPADDIFRMVQELVRFDDHFALVGAFEVCADWVQRDTRFIGLGEQLLDRLLADRAKLRNACAMFATAFMVATARLAVHDELRTEPVYWRRLAAASHASLVVRACGVGDFDATELITWATRVCGEEYLLSAYLDMAAEPQWRPEWADSRFMTADAFGRLYSTVDAFRANPAPVSWKQRIQEAKLWIDEDSLNFLMGFPAVLEGARRAHFPAVADLNPTIQEAYRLLADEPSLDNLLRLTPAIQAFGVFAGVNGAADKVIAELRDKPGWADDDAAQAALSLITHIAVLTNDGALADAIAEMLMSGADVALSGGTFHQLFFRLVECAAADTDRMAASNALAKRLEFLALRLPASDQMSSLVSLLEVLQKVSPDMSVLLGRAVTAARLASACPAA